MNNIQKSAFPYLVDVKITEVCPFGCPFCYTSSTTEGKPADSYFLGTTLAETLLKSNVFEVVFGGGEPTLYKGSYNKTFGEIAAEYKRRNFKVGVTTKNYNWHKLPDFELAVKNIHTVAISANTVEELEKAHLLKTRLESADNEPQIKVYIQTIFGLRPWKDLQEFIVEARRLGYTNLTLLGYKDFGFGEGGKAHEIPDEWIDFMKAQYMSVGVDSIMVAKYYDKLVAAGVPPRYLVGAEGKASCYIDAVKKTIAASSFTKESLPLGDGYRSPTLLEQFATF